MPLTIPFFTIRKRTCRLMDLLLSQLPNSALIGFTRKWSLPYLQRQPTPQYLYLFRQILQRLYRVMSEVTLLQLIKKRTDNKISQNVSIGNHVCLINNREYLVLADVFSPVIFPSTEWLTNSLIKNMEAVDSFLDIGTGTGVTLIEVMLAKKCKFGLGTDINKSAIDNTLMNGQKHSVKINAQVSDVFDSLEKGMRFDVINWNYPFHFHSERPFQEMNSIERSVRDPDYVHLQKYLKGAKDFLTEKGRVFLGFSKSFGKEDKLREIAAKWGWSYKILEQTKSEENSIIPTFCLIEFVRQANQ